jgi:hypothetical protein
MIEVPVAEHDCEILHASVRKSLPDEGTMFNRNMRVIDQRFFPIDDSVAGNAQGERNIINSIFTCHVAVAFNATIIKSVNIRHGLKNPQMFCH